MWPYTVNVDQYKFLKYLKARPRTAGDVKKRFSIDNQKLDELLNTCRPYISYRGRNFSDSTKISIKNEGIVLVEHRSRLEFRTHLSMVISIISVILATLSIVLSPFFNAFFTRLYGL